MGKCKIIIKVWYQKSKKYFWAKVDVLQKLPFSVIYGVLGIIMMYIGVAGVISTTSPWLVRGDTEQHVDYIWRLYNGDIPARDEGISYPAFVEEAGKDRLQLASKNPPLFYLIHAPFVGPLLDSGHWQEGIAVGRLINILIGVMCVLALSWAGWLLGGKNRAAMALTLPALTTLIYRFTRLNVDFAVDVLLILITTLSLIYCYKILKDGPTTKSLTIITLLSISGMYVKIAFIVFFATNMLAIFISVVLHNKKIKGNLAKAAKITILASSIVVAMVAWYYYKYNYEVSGNIYTARPDGLTGGRAVRSLGEVLSSSDLWGLFYKNFTRNQYLSLLISGYALAGIMTYVYACRKTILKNKIIIWTVAIFSLSVIGTFLVQIKHADGIGSINFRYMLPALLPIGWVLSTGLLQHKWAKGMIAATVAILMGITSLGAYALPDSNHFSYAILNNTIGGIFDACANNGLPGFIPTVLLLSFLVGSILFLKAMYNVHSQSKNIIR